MILRQTQSVYEYFKFVSSWPYGCPPIVPVSAVSWHRFWTQLEHTLLSHNEICCFSAIAHHGFPCNFDGITKCDRVLWCRTKTVDEKLRCRMFYLCSPHKKGTCGQERLVIWNPHPWDADNASRRCGTLNLNPAMKLGSSEWKRPHPLVVQGQRADTAAKFRLRTS